MLNVHSVSGNGLEVHLLLQSAQIRFFRPCAIPCHSKPNSLTVSENAQIRFILRFILLFSEKTSHRPNTYESAGRLQPAAKTAIKRHPTTCNFSDAATMGKTETTHGYVPISNNLPQQDTASATVRQKQKKGADFHFRNSAPFIIQKVFSGQPQALTARALRSLSCPAPA